MRSTEENNIESVFTATACCVKSKRGSLLGNVSTPPSTHDFVFRQGWEDQCVILFDLTQLPKLSRDRHLCPDAGKVVFSVSRSGRVRGKQFSVKAYVPKVPNIVALNN